MITFNQLMGALGVPLVHVLEHKKKDIGHSPTSDAFLCLIKDKICVYYRKLGLKYIDPILHEACHAIVGPDSLNDEGTLMIYQWFLFRELYGEEYIACRKDWGYYQVLYDDDKYDNNNFPWCEEIGPTNIFLRQKSWLEDLEKALDQGLVIRKRGIINPVFGLGVHPGWEEK